MLLEICCYTPGAAVMAEKAGANRIELCDNPGEGGTTPSYGVLKWVRKNLTIPVFPIIRPRGGHFVYSVDEISMMVEDIRLCKKLGFEGVVIGCLNENGEVAFEETVKLVEEAWPMEVTFHRAFDRVKDPYEALEKIILAGCHRILTSGQTPTAAEGFILITKLVHKAGHDIIVMPGSGVRSSNIARIASETGASEFHSSAQKLSAEPWFCPPSMQEKIHQFLPDPLEISKMTEALKPFNHNSLS